MPDGSPWPKVSIVTPSYNQADFIEETIRSVLLQGYPNLEYIVVDGGSIDQSVDIIRKYEPWLSFWISEPDGGQTDALNKGFSQATGEILGWINSDDLYCPGALGHSVNILRQEEASFVYGGFYNINNRGNIIDKIWASPYDPRYMLYNGMDIAQVASFWESDLMRSVGLFDQDLEFCMDRDLLIRLIWEGRVARTTKYLGMFRRHGRAKTTLMQDTRIREVKLIQIRYQNFHNSKLPNWVWRVYLWLKRKLLIIREAGFTFFMYKLEIKIKKILGF